MKKLICLLTVAIMLFGLCACGNAQPSVPTNEPSAPTSEASESKVRNQVQWDVIDTSPSDINDLSKSVDIDEIMNSLPDEKKEEKEDLSFTCNNELAKFRWWYIPEYVDSIKVISEKYKNNPSNVKLEGRYKDTIPFLNNEIPIKDLMVLTGFEIYVLATIYGNYTICCGWSSSSRPEYFPYLRQADENYYYTVLKIENGGWVYVFFERTRYGDDFSLLAPDPTYYECCGAVYMENVLTYSDFASIQIGSTLEEVSQIDSAAKSCKVEWDYTSKLPTTTFVEHQVINSKHLLKDGLLTITYKQENGNYIVSDMNFSPEFKYYSPFFKDMGWYKNTEIIRTYKILEQDYPPAK